MSQGHVIVVQAALEITANPSLCFISTALRLLLYITIPESPQVFSPEETEMDSKQLFELSSEWQASRHYPKVF